MNVLWADFNGDGYSKERKKKNQNENLFSIIDPGGTACIRTQNTKSQ